LAVANGDALTLSARQTRIFDLRCRSNVLILVVAGSSPAGGARKKTVTKVTVFFQRCVTLARNVMRTACVMQTLSVMHAFGA